MTTGRNGKRLSTIQNAFEIIELLKALDGATLTEISTYLELPTSTVFNYLITMEEIGYLVNEDGEYRVGMRFYEIGTYAKHQIDILETVDPILEAVAEETGEVVWFLVEEHGKVVYVENAEGKHAIPTATSMGEQGDMHCTAAGKVILAYQSEQRVRDVLGRHGMDKKTEDTITEREEFLTELNGVRKQGIAFNDEESAPGLRAVAAPVFHDGDVIAAISIPGPANRLTGNHLEEYLPKVLLDATNELDLKLRYDE